jgi:hypothetical protein
MNQLRFAQHATGSVSPQTASIRLSNRIPRHGPSRTRQKKELPVSSQRRIDSSRRNGALSRGPKTPAGKRRSSINSTRHGLLAKCVVLEGESEENLQLLLGKYIDKFTPHDDVELGMVEDMVACYWRLRRAMSIETHLFDRAVVDLSDSGLDSDLGQAWGRLNFSSELTNLYRYQTMLHRMHQRALANFLILRDIGPDDPELPSEPSPISGHSAKPSAPPPPTGPQAVQSPERKRPRAQSCPDPAPAVKPLEGGRQQNNPAVSGYTTCSVAISGRPSLFQSVGSGVVLADGRPIEPDRLDEVLQTVKATGGEVCYRGEHSANPDAVGHDCHRTGGQDPTKWQSASRNEGGLHVPALHPCMENTSNFSCNLSEAEYTSKRR